MTSQGELFPADEITQLAQTKHKTASIRKTLSGEMEFSGCWLGVFELLTDNTEDAAFLGLIGVALE